MIRRRDYVRARSVERARRNLGQVEIKHIIRPAIAERRRLIILLELRISPDAVGCGFRTGHDSYIEWRVYRRGIVDEVESLGHKATTTRFGHVAAHGGRSALIENRIIPLP